MHFPRLVIPLATVLTAGFNLAVNLLAVLAFFLVYGIDPMPSWILLPVVLLPLILLTTGVAAGLSALYVRYRDVQPIWIVASTLLFYGSPVLYTVESVPEGARDWFLVNPLAAILETARVWMVDASAPTVAEIGGSALTWLPPLALLLAVLAVGLWLFSREAPRVAEEL
jgi:ABC-2 type transport system permease protein